MARPLLEIWRELNRDREREPSSLMARAIASARPKPLSVVEQAIADVGRQISSPGFRERERFRRQIQKIDNIAGRVLGKPRPVSPPRPESARSRKRKPGAGRPRRLTPEQIEEGINILRTLGKMTVLAACTTLRAAGINAKDTTLYVSIIRFAYKDRK